MANSAFVLFRIAAFQCSSCKCQCQRQCNRYAGCFRQILSSADKSGRSDGGGNSVTGELTAEEINLDCPMIRQGGNQEKIRLAKEKYGEKIALFDPSELGTVLIASETDKLTVQDTIGGFDMELLDDCFERSLQMEDEYRERSCAIIRICKK